MKKYLLIIIIITGQRLLMAQEENYNLSTGITISLLSYVNDDLRVPNTYFNKSYGVFICAKKNRLNYQVNFSSGKLLNINNNMFPQKNIMINIKSGNLKFEYDLLISNLPVKLNIGINAGGLFSTIKMDSLTGNNPYYVWSDGTLRNKPENYQNISTADIIGRDYIFETEISQPINFFVGPGISFSLKMTNRFSFGISSYYDLVLFPGQFQTKSSTISGFFLSYQFTGGWKELRTKKQNAKKLDEIMYLDTDGDGTNDLLDKNPSKK